jgi:cobalamin biosynthesis protein CbiD
MGEAFTPDERQRLAFRLIANTRTGASLHGVSARMGLSMLGTKEIIMPMVRRRWLKRLADGAVYEATDAGRRALAEAGKEAGRE